MIDLALSNYSDLQSPAGGDVVRLGAGEVQQRHVGASCHTGRVPEISQQRFGDLLRFRQFEAALSGMELRAGGEEFFFLVLPKPFSSETFPALQAFISEGTTLIPSCS